MELAGGEVGEGGGNFMMVARGMMWSVGVAALVRGCGEYI